MKLFFSALIKFFLGVGIVFALLFIPAGSLGYIKGWLFMGLLFLPMSVLGAVLLIKAPKLLEKRLNAGEESKTQRGVVGASALLFIVGFVVAGLDYRLGWSEIPMWATIAASVILLTSYALYAEVMRENAYLSRTVEVAEDQQVVDHGLYGIVRHPMYAVTILLFLSIPIVLGSFFAFICFLPYVPIIIVRMLHEERLLERELSGYTEYKSRVKYRLIPFIW